MFSFRTIVFAICLSGVLHAPLLAEFTTVYNLPDDSFPSPISSDTQINVYEGATLPYQLRFPHPWRTLTIVELNIYGGTASRYLEVYREGTVNLYGSNMPIALEANDAAIVNIRGGILDHGIKAEHGSQVHFVGGDFQLNGIPLTDLNGVGDQTQVTFDSNSMLTGVLANGTPFSLLGEWDEFDAGTLSFELAPLPPIGPALQYASTDPHIYRLREGQTLIVDDELGRVQAGHGSVTRVTENVSLDLEAIGAEVDLRAGELTGRAIAGSTVNIDGGTLTDSFDVHSSSTVNLHSGEIHGGSYSGRTFYKGSALNLYGGIVRGRLRAYGTVINGSGGRIQSSLQIYENSVANIGGTGAEYNGVWADASTVNLSAGVLSALTLSNGSQLNLSGGQIRETLVATSGNEVTLVGGEFVLNGQLVQGLDSLGDTVLVDVPDGAALSGFLSDGSPFSFSHSDFYQSGSVSARESLAGARVILQRSQLPVIESARLLASMDTIPKGLRSGQTLTVDAGAEIGDYFGAGQGSDVSVETGGVIGRVFEAAGARVHVNGGTISSGFDISNGSVVDVTTGELGGAIDIFAGGELNVLDGNVGKGIYVGPGGSLNVTGGIFTGIISISQGASANIQGGVFGDGFTVSGQPNIMGATFTGTASLQNSGMINGGHFHGAVEVSTGTIAGGQFDSQFHLNRNGSLTITGGHFKKGFKLENGSSLRIVGGNLDGYKDIGSSAIEVSGGVISDDFYASPFVSFTIVGSEFLLNGEPLDDWSPDAETHPLDLPDEYLLTGYFADGTPFAFNSWDRDRFREGVLTLKRSPTPLPEPMPRHFVASIDPLPVSIHKGQSLTVDAGSNVPNNLMAGPGSFVRVSEGGTLGSNFETLGGTIIVEGGFVGQGMDGFAASNIEISGGEVGAGIDIFQGSRITVSGGTIGGHPYLNHLAGRAIEAYAGKINISGGELGNILATEGTSITYSGGRAGQVHLKEGATIDFSGGAIESLVTRDESNRITIFGDDFHINGEPVTELRNNGDSLQIVFDSSSDYTGILADGTPFALTHITGDYIRSSSTLIFEKTDLPEVGPRHILASQDAVPYGIRQGQTLTIDAGAIVGHSFTAGPGSRVDILPGGYLAKDSQAVGATVNLRGGTIASGFTAYSDSVVNIHQGEIQLYIRARRGSAINMTGGSVTHSLSADEGSTVNITGGEIGGAEGEIGGFSTSGLANISGGTFAKAFKAFEGSEVHFFGTAFHYDNLPINGLELGVPSILTERGFQLSGQFAQGEEFRFSLNGEFRLNDYDTFTRDYFSPNSLVTITLVHNPGDYNGDGVVNYTDYDVWLAALETGNLAADGNYDRKVDEADRTVWENTLGITYFVVPEPLSFQLVILFLGISVVRIRINYSL
ncbi:hypothetical protein [Adhaeretor mobilis]|uniref:Lipoprotein n=1 Tax=Adhaeretor mobilis TaxID=1930276 RepID=A0A517MRX1_9BACT|nr:hypothetical protein [Adhaeretor mobilis]QDS97632.1 hypothetical protein HG15A2_08960 [Adhaeretor mobilis]